jgi:hypothetical protein
VGLKAVKKKKATKAWGKHQRIYIRRSLRTKERGPLRQAQGPVEQKVQMEELQWGFPIATPLSLNKPTSINGK